MVTKTTIAETVSQASSLVKLIDGVVNNAAWAACLDAYECIEPLKRFNRQVKGGDTAGHGYKRMLQGTERIPAQPHLRLRQPLLSRCRHDGRHEELLRQGHDR